MHTWQPPKSISGEMWWTAFTDCLVLVIVTTAVSLYYCFWLLSSELLSSAGGILHQGTQKHGAVGSWHVTEASPTVPVLRDSITCLGLKMARH